MEDLQNGKLDNLVRFLAKFSEKLSAVSATEDLFSDWSMEAIKDLKHRFNIQRVIVVGNRGMMGKRTRDLWQIERAFRNVKSTLDK